MKTLFGEIEFEQPSKCQGHADVPGYGPKGETCGTCQHIVRVRGGSRNYLKCKLVRQYWTAGYGTDIRAKDPACRLWKPKTTDESEA